MKFLLPFLLLPALAPAAGEKPPSAPSAIIAIGAGGDEEYTTLFEKWADRWRAACTAAKLETVFIGTGNSAKAPDREQLRLAISAAAPDGPDPLWIVLLGHGTFNGRDAKFNLRGDDASVEEVAEWVKPFARPVVIVAGFASSGAWLKALSGPNRIVLTATRNGGESNFSRFGGYLAQTIVEPAADLDHDGQTSLLEAWQSAAKRTDEFYQSDGRLVTEHSLLEDNGDGIGTPADWFEGIRVTKKSKSGAAADGLRAHRIHLVPSDDERRLSPELREKRDVLEIALARLRENKASMLEDEYYAKIETILLELARLYRESPVAQ